MGQKKLYIVKIGGNVIDDAAELKKFLCEFAKINGPKILIHGGGKVATDLAKKLGVSQAMVNGRRITDAETLKIATMVYAGLLNKQIVAQLQSNGVNALGLSGPDLNVINAKKREHADGLTGLTTGIDFGFVGDVLEDGVNTEMLSVLIEMQVCPVLCAITHDGKGQLLNTNADTIASVLAVALSKKYEVQLNYCFEKKGVLSNVNDESSIIETMSKTEYLELVKSGIVSKGMIPKLDNSFDAISKGVQRVIIGHSDELLKMTNENAGTKLIA